MWGQPGVTSKLSLFDSANSWLSGSQPVAINIKRGDILRELTIQTSGSITLSGGTNPVQDVHGPYNLYNNVSLGPSNSAKIVNVSGYGLYLINLLKQNERESAYTSPIVPVQNAAIFGDVSNYPSSNGFLRSTLNVPVGQFIKSLGFEIGLWQLSIQTMNMVLSLSPNTVSAASPYSIYNASAGVAPYTGGATSPNATITNPQIDVLRHLYKNPLRPEDYPPVDFVSVWQEDSFTNVNSKQPTYTFPANSGLIARAAINLFDATAGNGADIGTYLTTSSAVQLLYGTSDVKISESGYEQREREALDFGFVPPRGVMFFDFLGTDLTLADVLNTAALLNVRFQLSMDTPLPANSSATVVYQLLQPIVGSF